STSRSSTKRRCSNWETIPSRPPRPRSRKGVTRCSSRSARGERRTSWDRRTVEWGHTVRPSARGASRPSRATARRPKAELPPAAGSPARQTDERMTRLVEVPAHFDDRSFDQFAGAFAEARRDDERLLFDARAAEWASPYGLVGLLAAGQAARRPGSGAPAERPLLTAPTSPEVLSYWARAGFFREAAELFEIHGKVPRVKAAEESEVLLPVTPVRA